MNTWKALLPLLASVHAERIVSNLPAETTCLLQQGNAAQKPNQKASRQVSRPSWMQYITSWKNYVFERTKQCTREKHRRLQLRNVTAHVVLESSEWRWWTNLAEASTPGATKLALLFMIKDRIHNVHIWRAWLQRATSDGVTLGAHVHAYDLNKSDPEVQKNMEAWPHLFQQGLLKRSSKSTWGNIWKVQLELLRNALKDKQVSHVAWMDQTSIPVAPARLIYRELQLDPNSRFCADMNLEAEVPRAETWSMMQRGDVEVIVQNQARYRKMIRDWRLYDEQYFFWPLHIRNMKRKQSGRKSTLHYDMERGCYHFTDWLRGTSCDTHTAWANKTILCNCPHLKRSLLSHYPDKKHPATFMQIDRKSFEELWNSPFWFARKFDDGGLDASHTEVATL